MNYFCGACNDVVLSSLDREIGFVRTVKVGGGVEDKLFDVGYSFGSRYNAA